MKKMKSFLITHKKFLFLALLLAGVLGFAPASAQAVYFYPGVNLDTPSLSADHNTLSFTVNGSAGIEQLNCGEDLGGPEYVGGPYVYRPYVMQGGSFSASAVSGTISSGEIVQTSSGHAGVSCDDESRSDGSLVDSGEEGAYSVSKSGINVSSLSNGTYTLSVTLCTVSGVCNTDTASFTIARSAPAISGYCTGTPNPVFLDGNVTWTASASGGTGSYTYSWSGAVSGSGSIRTTSYQTEGTKTANVTISSGGQSVTKSCSVMVAPPPDETCTIEVNSNDDTQWIIGGDGFSSYLSGSGTGGNYPPNPPGHPQKVGDGFGIIASDLAGRTKTVTPSANQTCSTAGQVVTFNITYRMSAPGAVTVECSGPTSGAPGQNLTFSASKGSELGYTWSGGQNPSPTGNGASFTTSFSTAGSKTITLRDSAGNTDTCPVTISSGLSCLASPSSVGPGEQTTLSAGGGTGAGYSWNTGGGNPTSGSGPSLNVFYNSTGSKTVTLTDSSGAQAQCYLSVQNSTDPTCVPATQTVNVGEQAYITTYPARKNGNWYSLGATPDRLYDAYTYRPSYQTAGLKSVIYSPFGIHPDKTCTVNVVEPQVNNASCVAMTHPTQVVTGQQFQASVTMRNTGTTSWTTDASPHRLGSKNPNGNNVWGLTRVNLPFSPVNVGQQVTFNFTATAPSTAGTRSFDWGMLEETVQWFGQTCVASPQINVVCGGNVNVSSNLATTWRLTGPDGVVNQTAPAISQSYTGKPTGTYNLSNIPTIAGYETPTVAPAASQALSCNSAINFTINYQCTDQDGDNMCDSTSGCASGNCGGGPSGPDNCPDDYNPDQADTDGDGVGDVCDDGEPIIDGGEDFALSSTNNIRVDKNAGETQSNATTIKVMPYDGYDTAVALSVLSGPAVEYFFGDDSLSSGEYSTGSSLYVVIPSDFPRGNYPIQVRGLSGGIVRTTTVILSVDEAGPIFEEF